MNQNRKMGQVGTKKGLLAKQLVAEEGISWQRGNKKITLLCSSSCFPDSSTIAKGHVWLSSCTQHSACHFDRWAKDSAIESEREGGGWPPLWVSGKEGAGLCSELLRGAEATLTLTLTSKGKKWIVLALVLEQRSEWFLLTCDLGITMKVITY